MASALKREPIKYIRDRAKAAYQKGIECYICGSTERLDFHHFYTLTPLFNKWCRENKIQTNTETDVLAIRDRFIAEHKPELYDHAVTLCHNHHMKLHSLYGKDPALTTAEKQMRWVRLQREKNELPILDS